MPDSLVSRYTLGISIRHNTLVQSTPVQFLVAKLKTVACLNDWEEHSDCFYKENCLWLEKNPDVIRGQTSILFSKG